MFCDKCGASVAEGSKFCLECGAQLKAAAGEASSSQNEEERRKKGVANKMFDVALKWFKKNKVKTVELRVATINPEAQAVWKSLGFAPFMIYERLYPDKLPQRPVPTVRKRIVRKKKETKKKGLTQRIRFSRGSA